MDIIARIISIVLISVIISFLFRYLRDKTEKELPQINSEGNMVLKINKIYGIVGWFSVLLAVIILILDFIFVKEISEILAVALLFLLFFSLGLPLVLFHRNVKLEINDLIIRYFGFTGKVSEIEWKDIRKVKFGKSSLELKLMSENAKVKVHMHLNGFPGFLELMKEKLDYSIYKDALVEIELAKGRMVF